MSHELADAVPAEPELHEWVLERLAEAEAVAFAVPGDYTAQLQWVEALRTRNRHDSWLFGWSPEGKSELEAACRGRLQVARERDLRVVEQLGERWAYDTSSLTDASLRAVVLDCGEAAGHPPLVPLGRDIDDSAWSINSSASWRRVIQMRADRGDLEDILSRLPPHVVESRLDVLVNQSSETKPTSESDRDIDVIARAKDAFQARSIMNYSRDELDAYLRPVIHQYRRQHPRRAVELKAIAQLLDVPGTESSLSRAVSKKFGTGWRAYVQKVLSDHSTS
jgi:hypothetical protein